MAGPRKPRAGTIESFVKWAVERSKPVLDIINSVQSKFPRGRIDLLPDYLKRWYAATGKQPGSSLTTTLSDRQRADLAQYRSARGFERTTAYVDWLNPRDSLLETKSFYVDLPTGLKGAKRQQELLNRLAVRLAELYEGSIKTQADLARFVISVKEERED